MSTFCLRLQRARTAAEDAAHLKRLAGENGSSSIFASSPARTRRSQLFGRGVRAMPTVRRPGWTAEEDARLERLARENGLAHWSRVARRMPGRSRRSCRTRWRHLVAAEREVRYLRTTALVPLDDDEVFSHPWSWRRRWRAFTKAARSCPEKTQEYWSEFMEEVATGFAEEGHFRPTPLPDVVEPEPARKQHCLVDVLAAGLSSCSLAPVDPRAGSLALGIARMTI